MHPTKSIASIILVASVCTWTSTSLAQRLLAPQQALSFVRASDLHLSPDASKLAYVANSYSWDAKPQVRILDVATGAEQELTPPGKAERSPQWSPDGKALAFLSSRSGETQIYVVTGQNGEPRLMTAMRFGVGSFHWSPDGRSIGYLAREDTAQPHGEGPQLADREDDLSRLWLVDVQSKAVRRLGLDGWRIDEFQWQDPTSILIVASDRPRVEEPTDAIYRLWPATGAVELVSAPPQPFDSLLVSPDALSYVVRSTSAHGPMSRDLFIGWLRQGVPRPVFRSPDLAIAELRWPAQSAPWARVVDGFHNRIIRLSADTPPLNVDLPLSAAGFDLSKGGDLVYVGEDFDHLSEIYLRSKSGRTRQLTHLQKGWEGIKLAKTSIFSTRSFDGTLIEAALMKPYLTADGRAPLILLVHGGPSANFTAGFGWESAWAQLLAAHGYQVLMVNPRGSNGYGEAFLEANRGDWGGGDYKDLMAVLDAVIAQGEVDPERLGIGGWSYGGEMSTWAITQTQRFKAAIAGAGVFDQQAEFESEAHPDGDEWYFGTPWEHPDVFVRNSPATYIRNARTPVLILDGEDDANNPVGQSKGLYRALKHFGVEAQMVLYPGEGHSPRKEANNMDIFQRTLDWFDAHLK